MPALRPPHALFVSRFIGALRPLLLLYPHQPLSKIQVIHCLCDAESSEWGETEFCSDVSHTLQGKFRKVCIVNRVGTMLDDVNIAHSVT